MKRAGGRDEWQVWATTDRLAAGRRKLRDALAEIVRKAVENGWVNKETTDRWLDKLRSGLTLREGWPKYEVGLVKGALAVRYTSISIKGIEREARRLRAMGLVEGRHFAVKMLEGGREGYVSILREGLAYAVWLSIHGSGEQRRLAAEFIGYMLERAGEEGKEVHEKAVKIVKRGREVGSLRLADVRGAEVEVRGKMHVVGVLGGGAQPEKGWSGKILLRIKITAEG